LTFLLPGFLLFLLLLLVRYGYGWVMAGRTWLYQRGWRESEAFDVPVIVLGNLRVGGTGKSPHAAYVVQTLLTAGHRVALLSRGYGRRTRGFRLVAPTDSAATVGDEPLEQARRFAAELATGNLVVAVAEARRLGVRALLDRPAPPDVIVLDDAYQHLAVRPSLLLLLTEFHRPFSADRVLPLGRLREFAGAARRADAVVVTKCPPDEARPDVVRGLDLKKIRRATGPATPVFFTTYAYDRWQPLRVDQPSRPLPLPQPSTPIVVLTAIDNPAPMLDYLLAHSFTIARHLRFPDHHAFTPADLAALLTASGPEKLPIVTTGKDATRLLDDLGQPHAAVADLPVWWVPVQVREIPAAESVAPANLRELVLDHVRRFRSAARVLAVLTLGFLLLALPATAQQTPTNPATPPTTGATPTDQTASGQPKRPRRLLNDTSQTLYGPRTTLRFTEADVLAGNNHGAPLDTAFREMWNPRRWYHDSTFQQDLGNVGTAARSVIWPVGQPQTGIRWGRRAFDRYAYDVSTIPYYNTRSPYSHISYVQGGLGEQVFEVRYTRNIRKVFNFGGAYERLSSNKQFSPSQTKDNMLVHASAVVWAAYATPDSTWRVMASYSHMAHEVVEQGGTTQDIPRLDSTIRYTDATVNLSFADNREFRNSWHMTQLLRLAGPGLQLFYTFDRRTQANRFQDWNSGASATTKLPELTNYFPAIYLDSTRTEDRARFQLNQHTAGVLGTARFGAYRLYASRRDARYTLYDAGAAVAPDSGDTGFTQPRRVGRVALGGQAQFRVRDLIAVTADGELQSGDNTYWLRATARFRWLSVSQLRNGYAPTLTENAFYGNHFRWENQFDNTQRDETRATAEVKLGQQHFWLDGTLTRVRNYVYYGLDGLPQQEKSTLTIGTVQGRYRGQFGKLVLGTRAAFTARPGRSADVIRTPEIIGDVLVAYQGFLLKKALFGQVGIQTYVQSASRALAWQPATQQFYLQDAILLPAYPQVDVFFAADLKNVNVFLKVAHANYGLTGKNGYALTPGYPQLRRSITFGVKWMFFD
jgi:tetraacyldisaccharide 4'-kinase